MSTERKVLVIKADSRATMPREILDRKILFDLRASLMRQVRVIEKFLGIAHRCKQCGFVDK